MTPARGPACQGPNCASGRLLICQLTPDGSRPTFGDEAPKRPTALPRQCISILVAEDSLVELSRAATFPLDFASRQADVQLVCFHHNEEYVQRKGLVALDRRTPVMSSRDVHGESSLLWLDGHYTAGSAHGTLDT